MQDMIKRIIEADSEAKALEQKNQKAAEREKERIEEEAAAIYQRYMDEAQSEIVRNDTYFEKRFDRKRAEAAAKQESALIKLRTDFEQNRDKWVDEIVGRVLNDAGEE